MPLAGKYTTIEEDDGQYHESKTGAKLSLEPELSGSRRIGIAVIGVGRMGAIHLDNVIREPRAKLLYALDASPEKLDYMRRKYFLDDRQVKLVKPEEYDQVLQDKRVEALLISTPTSTHEDYVKRGILHNKHIICEKPIATNHQQIQGLLSLAQERKTTLICAFQRRLDPSFRNVKNQLDRGDIGSLRVIKTCSRDSPTPPLEYIRTSGGLFHDCIVHDLDCVLWLAQELPTEVYSISHCYDEKIKQLNDFDVALVTLKFKSGLMSVTDVSRSSVSGYDQRIEVYGETGMLKVDEVTRLSWEKHSEIGITKPSNCYSFSARYYDAYATEIGELFNHIEGNKVMEVSRPSYLMILCKLIDACEQSARTGMSVKINWTQEELQQKPL